jgi:hypothetical protein
MGAVLALGAAFTVCIVLLARVKDSLHMATEMITHLILFVGVGLPGTVLQLLMERGQLPLTLFIHIPIIMAQIWAILATFVFSR